jgi:hypothetical protein
VTLVKSGALFLAMVLALFGMAQAQDMAFAVHMGIMALAALAAALAVMASADVTGKLRPDTSRYDDEPIRWGVIGTTFWGVVGLAAGLFIALQLAWPVLNFGTEAREYAEPEWYVDLWLTIVWVAYLVVFGGTIIRRREPHIYVANWFYLAFIITVAMLHTVNNLSLPASLTGSKRYSVFAGVQDALTQWWYGHNAVGFFLTAGFLAMMYYFVPKQAERPVHSYRLSIIHFWSLIFLYIWAGPHHLHYAALPDWAQSLGMVFSVMLWMPSWGGMIACLAVYDITPWIRWDRGPWAPDQAVLVDLAGPRFYMFDIEIWPQEFVYIAGLLIMAGIGLCGGGSLPIPATPSAPARDCDPACHVGRMPRTSGRI